MEFETSLGYTKPCLKKKKRKKKTETASTEGCRESTLFRRHDILGCLSPTPHSHPRRGANHLACSMVDHCHTATGQLLMVSSEYKIMLMRNMRIWPYCPAHISKERNNLLPMDWMFWFYLECMDFWDLTMTRLLLPLPLRKELRSSRHLLDGGMLGFSRLSIGKTTVLNLTKVLNITVLTLTV